MLQPARRKYRKEQKGRNTGIATRGSTVAFGDFGLKSTDRGRLTARQIESARRAISRHVKRGGRIWIRIFPDKPISQKPAEVRMGNGKGNPEYYVPHIMRIIGQLKQEYIRTNGSNNNYGRNNNKYSLDKPPNIFIRRAMESDDEDQDRNK